MYIKFNGYLEVLDDNNDIVAKKKIKITSSDFYSVAPKDNTIIKENLVWEPGSVSIGNSILKYDINIASKLQSK